VKFLAKIFPEHGMNVALRVDTIQRPKCVHCNVFSTANYNPTYNNMKKLTKSHNKKFAGVLAGIAEYFDIDTTLVRIVFVFVVIFTGFIPGLLFYIIAAAIMPVSPLDPQPSNHSTVRDTTSHEPPPAQHSSTEHSHNQSHNNHSN